MRLKSLILKPDIHIDWDRFERLIHDKFDVNAVSFNRYGLRRTISQEWANSLCDLIKAHSKAGEQICNALQQSMLKRARLKREYVTDECAAGIYRRLFPVMQGLEIEGFFGVCGRPFSTTGLMYPEFISKLTGKRIPHIGELISSLKPIGPKRIKEMTCFIMDQGFEDCILESPPLVSQL